MQQESIKHRLMHAWNAFFNKDPTNYSNERESSYRPDRLRLRYGNEKSIVTPIYNRIAMDVAAMIIQHVRLDEHGNYVETIDSGLNQALTISANVDQTGRALIQDIVMSMFDEGCVAVVPVDASLNPSISGSYDVLSMRTGKILGWLPSSVRARVYDERDGQRKDITVQKQNTAIIENPLYSIMNEPNGVAKRLIAKLNLLDAIEESSSGKLDLIIQFPFAIKSESRKQQAEERRGQLQSQLKGSQYGVAYADATERITQLNRPAENNLIAQVNDLTSMLFDQLGMTKSILDGTADEQTMINYHNRTVEPVLAAIVEEMHRKFLTKTARTQKQAIAYFRNAFKLVPVSQLAEVADKFTRNAILSSNEFRAIVGYKPSDDPEANKLSNKNLNEPPKPQASEKDVNQPKGEIKDGKEEI